MAHQHLTHNIPGIQVTECAGSFLITVPNSYDAAIVLERVIKHNVRCWIGLQHQHPNHELSIYAAHPLQLWMVKQQSYQT